MSKSGKDKKLVSEAPHQIPEKTELQNGPEPNELPKPISDRQRFLYIFLGIAAPAFCLVLDPIVFRTRTWRGGHGFLFEYQCFAYLEIAIGTAALVFYLRMSRGFFILTGMLAAASIFSLLLGIKLLPLAVMALLIIIGILGFTPFATSIVFAHAAIHCWKDARRGAASSLGEIWALIAFAITLGMPFVLQLHCWKSAERALVLVQSKDNREFEQGIRTFKWIPFTFDEQRFVNLYLDTKDESLKKRVAEAYRLIRPGQDIEKAVAAADALD